MTSAFHGRRDHASPHRGERGVEDRRRRTDQRPLDTPLDAVRRKSFLRREKLAQELYAYRQTILKTLLRLSMDFLKSVKTQRQDAKFVYTQMLKFIYTKTRILTLF